MYFEFNKYKLYYEKHGIGKKNILILPGWGNTRLTFQKIIKQLENEYTVYIIDYPGFGNSKVINKELTIYDYALIIKSFIEKNNLIQTNIIAHSFGGRITSILLSEYNIKINKLILIDVAGIKRLNIKIKIKNIIYKLLKKLTCILPKRKKFIVRKKLFNLFSSNDYKTLPKSMYKTFQNIISINLKKYYKNITNKTLIIWGSNDQATPLKDAYTLKKIIKNSKLIVYKDSSHFSYLENHNEIIKNISNFL